VDRTVDIDVGDMDTARTQIARRHLRQPPQRELGGSEGGRSRKRLDSGGRAGEQDHSPVLLEHAGYDLLAAEEGTEGTDPPGVLERTRLGLHQAPKRTHRGVVNQDVGSADLAANP